MKLSQHQLPAGKTDAIFFDPSLPGFGLRIRAGGKRSWIVQYRNGVGATKRLKLGSASTLSEAQARDLARKRLAAVELGQDPAEDKAQKRREAAETFHSVVETYLAHQRKKLRPGSFNDTQAYLTGHLTKTLHAMPLAAIERRHVAAVLLVIEGKVSANRVRSALSAFFSWTIKSGLLDSHNPVSGTAKHKETRRERVLTDAELRAVWLATLENDFGAIVRLLVLTGQRRTEIAGLRWSEVDLDAGVIRLPAERTKNGRAHVVPLSIAAADILAARQQTPGRDEVFGRAAGGFAGFGYEKKRLDERLAASGIAPWTLHDLRRSCASGLGELEVSSDTIESLLNHARPGIAGVYNRSRLEDAKRRALDRWSEHLAAVVEGRPAVVVPLRAEGAR
jgi:integrase